MRLTPEVLQNPYRLRSWPKPSSDQRRYRRGEHDHLYLAQRRATVQASTAYSGPSMRPGRTGGSPISDNENDSGSHPEAERYTILHRDPLEYSLQIRDIRISDGGFYECMEAQASVVEKRTHVASLTVVGKSSGVIFSGQRNWLVYMQKARVPSLTIPLLLSMTHRSGFACTLGNNASGRA